MLPRRDGKRLNVGRLTAGALRRLSQLLINASRGLYLSPQERRVIPWFRDRGDKTWRLQYALGPNSIVVDLGGYEGQWSSDIYAMYGCHIHIFEPVAEFAQAIKRRFDHNPRIKVHQLGLGDRNNTMPISVAADGSSIHKSGKRVEDITIMRAADFLREQQLLPIDLLKINIEGAEYDLLRHLIETDCVSAIRNIQVQFHDFVPNAEQKMRQIQSDLERSHFLTYQYLFVWENWQLRADRPLQSP